MKENINNYKAKEKKLDHWTLCKEKEFNIIKDLSGWNGTRKKKQRKTKMTLN